MNTDEFRKIVEDFDRDIATLDADRAARRPSDGSWSLKEILGHLIDSAANNHNRFVRLIQGNLESFPTYKAADWVSSQSYQDADWDNLRALWRVYNRHLLHVVAGLPEDSLKNEWILEEDVGADLEWLVQDYYEHMAHHIRKFWEKVGDL